MTDGLDLSAAAPARRVYDRVNDAVSVGIKMASAAANATGHADNGEPADARAIWRDMEDELKNLAVLAIDALNECRFAGAEVDEELR